MISILLPYRNASLWIDETIDSIQSQRQKDWELLTVNDGSTDESNGLVEKHARADDRIRIYNNPGQGIIPALQKGLEEANGTYLCRMDADDLMPENRLMQMVNILEKSPEKTVITGMVRYFSDEKISDGYKKYESWLNSINRQGDQWQNIYRECVVASPNWMMRRKELIALGGFSGLTYPEDYHLAFQWYQNSFQLHAIAEVTLLWREHPLRTSRNSANYNQRAFFLMKIREFVRTDLKDGNLVIWGNNQKTNLVRGILTTDQIPFLQLEMRNYEQIAATNNPKLLVGVYPPLKERKAIENYLSSLQLVEGVNWWYL